jgi:hypothetical protein
MTQEGKEAWHAELPFTLYKAAVSDTGITAGVSYSHGLAGFGQNGPGTISTILIAPDGKIILEEAEPRDDPRVPDGLPGPVANGVLIQPEGDRLIMRIQSKFEENWRVYQLSTGKKLDTFDLHTSSQAPEGARYVLDARPLANVPLLLVHWWFYDNEKVGALFSIVDFKGSPVWSLELPRDYTIASDEKAEDRLRDEIRRDGAILGVGEAGRFEIRQVAEGVRTDFKVARDDNSKTGWSVTKISSKPYTPPKAAPATPVTPPPLRLLGHFDLQDRPVSGAIRDIQEFAFDGEGHIGFLRRETSGEMTFVLVDSKAAVLAEIPLPKLESGSMHTAWLGGTKWIVTTSPSAKGTKSSASWLDTEKLSLQKIDGFASDSVMAVRGSSDGSFVILAQRDVNYSPDAVLIGFDATGKQKWKHEASSDRKPSSLFSPEDFTITSRGDIAVVDNIRGDVKWFGTDGAFLRVVDLAKSWKRKPNYPSGITPDAAGGVIVYDFDGKPPFVRMRPDGSVISELSPKRGDGRAIDANTGLRAAPDGSLWACDGESFIQLSGQGVAISDIGSTADDTKLGEITELTGDAKGVLYAADRRTGAVHVFGPDGAKLRICKPAKDDFTGDLVSTHLAIAPDGGVLLRMERTGEGMSYLAFAPDGSRQGVKRLALDDITEEWHFQPGTGNILVLGYEEAFLTDPAGKILAKIERQADQRWFEDISGAAFAADGSFVIHSYLRWRGENHLSFFNATGEPLNTIRLETDGFAMLGGYNGRYITLAGENGVRVHNRDGKVVATTPKTEGNSSHILARGGKELWVIEHKARTISRYEMPE